MSKQTKSEIARAALALFNRLGTSRVSTNRIAAAAGISPGNLYYHFRNKEEIIRLLFDAMEREVGDVWQVAAGALDLSSAVAGHLTLFAKYRFLWRELAGLAHTDPLLRRRYRRAHARRFAQISRAVAKMVAAGLLRVPGGKAGVTSMVEHAWVLAVFWPHYLDLTGHPFGRAQIVRGANLILDSVRPYLVDATLAAVNATIGKAGARPQSRRRHLRP